MGQRSLAGIRILVAEDNEVNQILLRKFMRLWGAEIAIAEDGAEALEMAQDKHFDLVLMDIQMPVMDGYSASRKIRSLEDEYFKDLPIIAITASTLLEVKDRVLESGMNDYVNKPFSPEQLFDKIIQWVSAPIEKA
jgi:CheY-like chemotaxis protein